MNIIIPVESNSDLDHYGMKRIDGYPYLVLLGPFKELQSDVRAVAVYKQEPPLPSGFLLGPLVKELFQPFEANLVGSPATKGRREPSVMLVGIEVLDPSVLD